MKAKELQELIKDSARGVDSIIDEILDNGNTNKHSESSLRKATLRLREAYSALKSAWLHLSIEEDNTGTIH
jgi:hypothetical protein